MKKIVNSVFTITIFVILMFDYYGFFVQQDMMSGIKSIIDLILWCECIRWDK